MRLETLGPSATADTLCCAGLGNQRGLAASIETPDADTCTPPLLPKTGGLGGEPGTANYGATVATHGKLALGLASSTEPPPEPGARPLVPATPFPPLYGRLAPFSSPAPGGLEWRRRRLRLPPQAAPARLPAHLPEPLHEDALVSTAVQIAALEFSPQVYHAQLAQPPAVFRLRTGDSRPTQGRRFSLPGL